MIVSDIEIGSIDLEAFSTDIIPHFVLQCQKLSPSLKELLEHDLSIWAEQLDAEYAQLQHIDAVLRQALGESPGVDEHDVLIGLLDCVHQRMTEIEFELKQGPDFLLLGGDDE